VKAFAVIVVIAVIGFVLWRATQGSDVPDAPSPDLPIPDTPDDAAGDLWDYIEGLPTWVWTQAAPIVLLALALAWVSSKYPKLLWFCVGILVAVIAVVVITQN
jgi:hypothetical protein